MVTSITGVCPVWVYHRNSPGRPKTRMCATKEVKTKVHLPPGSKEEAIQQARDSLWHVLESPLRKRLEPAPFRKSSKKQQQLQQESRFRIEIPVADESDQALASLALDLLENAGVSKVCVVSGSSSVQESLKNSSRVLPQLQICSPQEDLAVDRDAAFILILAPSEIESVKRILARSGKRPLVLVNPEWSEEDEAEELSKSFQVAYSFTPLAIQALFFQKIQGAVLKQVPLSTPWRIFVQEDELNCVSSLNNRPTNADLEDALYNSVAARSPLVNSVKFLKSLIKWPGKNNSGSAALDGLTQAAKKQIWAHEQYLLKQKLICSDSFTWILPEKFGYSRDRRAKSHQEENQASIMIGSVSVDLPDGYVNPFPASSSTFPSEGKKPTPLNFIKEETVIKTTSTPTYLEKVMAGKQKVLMNGGSPPVSAQNVNQDDKVKETLKYVGGMDLSFVKEDANLACSALVVIDVETMNTVYEDFEIVTLEMPYLPGFLAFRESPALLKLLNKMKASCPEKFPQLIMTDGNGVLHPRGFGLASHLGVLADVPTVGIGKTLFEVDGMTEHDVKKRAKKELLTAGETIDLKGRSGTIWGCALKSTQSCVNPVYVSVGHRISLQTSVEIVKRLCRFRVPEPVRQADMKSREFLRVRGYTQT